MNDGLNKQGLDDKGKHLNANIFLFYHFFYLSPFWPIIPLAFITLFSFDKIIGLKLHIQLDKCLYLLCLKMTLPMAAKISIVERIQ